MGPGWMDRGIVGLSRVRKWHETIGSHQARRRSNTTIGKGAGNNLIRSPFKASGRFAWKEWVGICLRIPTALDSVEEDIDSRCNMFYPCMLLLVRF